MVATAHPTSIDYMAEVQSALETKNLLGTEGHLATIASDVVRSFRAGDEEGVRAGCARMLEEIQRTRNGQFYWPKKLEVIPDNQRG